MRSAFIHVGMPKSGTTAIQTALDTHRGDLARQGLCNPDTMLLNHLALITRFHPRGSSHFYLGNKGVSPAEAEAQARMLWAQVCAAPRDVVVSSEYLAAAHENYGMMAEAFVEAGLTPVFVCYVRHPVDAAISAAQQSVKRGERSISETVEAPKWANPVPTLRAAKATGHRVILRDYADARDTGVVRDFLAAIGYDHAVPNLVETRTNNSLSMEGAALAELYGAYLRETGKEPFPKAMIRTIPGTAFTLPEETKARVRETARREVDFIARHFGIHLRETATPRPFAPHLTTKTLVELLKKIGV